MSDQKIRKVTIGAAIGNFVEFFDFAIYGYAATTIATVFFPADADRSFSIIATLGLFGVAFFMRPLGGVVFGRVGDRFGRRTALSIVILMMAAATMGIGLTPGYARIGIAAPIILLICRLIQGFALGGEKSGASSFVAEHAPDRERGKYLGYLAAGSTLVPFSVGALVMAAISSTVSPESFEAWGWRIPFILGGVLGLVGLYVRTGLPETDAFKQLRDQRTTDARVDTKSLLMQNKVRMLQLFMAVAGSAGVFYLAMAYIPTYLIENVGLDKSTVFWTSAIAPIGYTVLAPFAGKLGDRIGRRAVLFIGAVGTVIFMVPAFLLAGSGLVLLAGLAQLLVLSFCAFSDLGISPGQVELFPTKIRYTAASVAFNTATALFGGTAALMSALLIDLSGIDALPAIYFAALALISIPFILAMPETSGRSLTDHSWLALPDAHPPLFSLTKSPGGTNAHGSQELVEDPS
ncbi:MFS transporter [Rhodococcus sp. NPDC059968]|uniref:MFS transporter n=1 Tax=Rhodococcus sp. NPDC059968 TaxID=3347017 RepID=UPI00366DA148